MELCKYQGIVTSAAIAQYTPFPPPLIPLPTGVQCHGKIWENEIISIAVFPDKLEEAKNQLYTAIHDIPAQLNAKTGKNVSIKATCSNRVDFGDALRVINTLEEKTPVEMIIIKYTQLGEIKVPKKVIRAELNSSVLGNPPPDLKERIQYLDRIIKLGDPAYKIMAKKLQIEMRECGSLMTLAPKIGNKNKKRAGRLQISLQNIDKFIKLHPELVYENNDSCDVYGTPCLSVLFSRKRVFVRGGEAPAAAPL